MRKLVIAIIATLATTTAIAAPMVSGDYHGLLIGVDRQGALTGYFESYTGKGQFSCVFFISGKAGGPATRVETWFPGDRSTREVIAGTVEAITEDGAPAIRVHLDDEHGGCWNVQHFASEPASFNLGQQGNWEAIRVVSAEKAYFYDDVTSAHSRKAYVVQGNALRVFESRAGWVKAEYVSPADKNTRGWIRERDLYSPISPTKK